MPAEIPVINPKSSIVATPRSLLDHVPPVPGSAVMVAPTQTLSEDVDTAGISAMLSVEVVLEQPVAVLVKVKLAVPNETPVIKPVAGSMVAAVGLLLIQVPPVVGLATIVTPILNVADGKLTVGGALTVTDDVVLLHPDKVSVKVKVALPAAIPVTTPASVTVATVLSLLTQVPPAAGVKLIISPTQTCDPAVTTGSGLTVTVDLSVIVTLQDEDTIVANTLKVVVAAGLMENVMSPPVPATVAPTVELSLSKRN